MEIDNPLLSKATRSDLRQPSNSTSVVPFEKPRKRISAKTERLIGELGLRYRPSVQADLEEHAATLALLTTDVADIPPDLLEQAIRRHVASSPYLPKASELIALAQECQRGEMRHRGDGPDPRLQKHCDMLNDMNWVRASGLPYFVNAKVKDDGSTEHFVDRKI